MNLLSKTIVIMAVGGGLCQLPGQVNLELGGRQIQIHGSFSEGFASSSDNNYLRMDTSHGSFFTEGGLSVSSRVTDKLRVGVQAYDRYIGELGKGKVYLDWALVDYHWKDWLGFRGGKIKTPLGLYNDTQDQEFLYTWALLPQSLYPIDLRAVSIAHLGGDIYGNIKLKRAGSLAYDAFTGTISNDPRGGYVYGVQAQGVRLSSVDLGKQSGVDLRWSTPVTGLILGSSLVYSYRGFEGSFYPASPMFSYSTTLDRATAYYGEYTRGNFRASAEYRAQTRRAEGRAKVPGNPVMLRSGSEEPAWFVSASQRISKRVEAGGYYSHYHVDLINPRVPVTGPGRDHIFDKVVTVRLDVTKFWDFKIEGHFMDGVGAPGQAHGFYPQDNPTGLKPKTNMLVIRTGWYF